MVAPAIVMIPSATAKTFTVVSNPHQFANSPHAIDAPMPLRAAAVQNFHAVSLPVTREYLKGQRLGPAFVNYMSGWKGFVVQEEAATVGA